MDTLNFSGRSGVLVLASYAALMLIIGFFAGRGGSGAKHSPKGHYLAGGNLGVVTLFFTLYATQYSGNTVIGYAPQAFREGFAWWQSVTFFSMIVAGYMLFAPRMHAIAKKHSFVTPTDWVSHRFGSTPLTVLAALLMLWALANYLLEQLIAMGQAITGLTGSTIPYQVGVTAFVLVMLAYSWSGGMRAVAMTDIMQGVALLLGVGTLLAGAVVLVNDLPAGNGPTVLSHHPEAMAVPSTIDSVNWVSMILMVGIGIAMYPHAIQRVYAARSARTLKRSLLPMVWMPLLTAGAVFAIGLLGLELFPDLSAQDSERLVGMIANEVAGLNVFFYVMMILLFGGVVAAVVSTADSALLSFSSIVSTNVYARYIRPDATPQHQVRVGKAVGVVAVFGILLLAWNPPSTLVEIFTLKIELLIQLAPAFVVGLYWKRLAAGPVFWGMLAGVLLAGGMAVAGVDALYGVHGGMLGLVLNLGICVLGSLLHPRERTEHAAEPGTAQRPLDQAHSG
ncbi:MULTISPECIES: sodium:solute symporter family protein [unclassified Actinopolyspora]|uniref:sodium:solute symporter family protein n=1 Tax=unclassified Actinopolyspora TaxID=2639451 RepID=UPI0013F65F16|nr:MULTISPECIES: sodium:solute symporter family protein [unclassified Actinopolyspora]NHD15881.1 sodium:solute symporter family protein [Actinopolyspora sp. BKK2]NHE74905.1 sodium:solute symporter family protein [Actinopolyspora sp. BKK1]